MKNIKGKIGIKNNLDKILFLIASLYLMTIVAWYWKQQKQRVFTSSDVAQEKETSSSVNENSIISTDLKLLPLDSEIQSPSSIPPLPLQNNNETLTIPPLSLGNGNSGTNPPPLPIPQPPSPNLPPPPPLPSISSSLPPLPSPQNTPPMTTANNSTAIPLPPPPPPKLTKVPTIATINNPQNTANTTNTINTINTTNNVIALANNQGIQTPKNVTLLGVLELGGSNSVALFNINNVTEKVAIGSEIGATGWVLMSINEKQAVISRQNQSLYLRVGEAF